MIRYLHSFSEPCGCTYSEGQWFACLDHPAFCTVCFVPIPRGWQGLCSECLDMLDREREWELKTSAA